MSTHGGKTPVQRVDVFKLDQVLQYINYINKNIKIFGNALY